MRNLTNLGTLDLRDNRLVEEDDQMYYDNKEKVAAFLRGLS